MSVQKGPHLCAGSSDGDTGWPGDPAGDSAYFVSGLHEERFVIPTLEPNTKLDRFTIIRCLGRGRTSAV